MTPTGRDMMGPVASQQLEGHQPATPALHASAIKFEDEFLQIAAATEISEGFF